MNEDGTSQSWDDLAAELASGNFYPVLLSRKDLVTLNFTAAAVQIRSKQSLIVHEPGQAYFKTGVADARFFNLLSDQVRPKFEDPNTNGLGVFVPSEVNFGRVMISLV